MRLNKFLASATALSRRGADEATAAGRVTVNGQIAEQGTDITGTDVVTLDGHAIHTVVEKITIMLNKPCGYVVSRNGQGSKTVYDLLPADYQQLNPIGRLDKDSSGLLLLTNDGQLAQDLTHPSKQKMKVYEVTLDKPLEPLHHQMLVDYGVQLEDGPSKFSELRWLGKNDGTEWMVVMHEGRNRQIRRTFAALGYMVDALHRTHFGNFDLDDLQPGKLRKITI
jgi:23S rRNA pseudouridine2605 synthase